MDSSITAIIAAGAALFSSALTGLITYKIAGQQQRSRDVDELRSALALYGATLDRFGRHLDQMPHPPGLVGRWVNRQVSRWRDLDWAMGRLSTGTLGRGAMRALDELITAMNRLLLIAPEDVLDAVLGISVLLERFEQRDDGWREEWNEARNAVARASRAAVPHL
ncbi:MAG TPA: hypothetical protein VNM38_07240 [Solirubrobacterales bacterium]|nr:hypothetical protein [Solirubrobacterales bacterium]